MTFAVDKTYGHDLGLSSCFRQPGAKSHCRDPHGYPLGFRLRFGCHTLDENNWVIDFGGLKPVKAWLFDNFDHRTILAENDEALEDFRALYQKYNFREPLVLPFVGCEGFALHVYKYVSGWLREFHTPALKERGLHLRFVEVREHGGNSAICEGIPCKIA
jgi:6-pyruvoyltetrahydropterin/6-carboxytetrahydropterin synthase